MSLAIPCLQIKNYEKAVAFYVDFLNFKIDFEWRHQEGFPVYMGISRGVSPGIDENALTCHLTEHKEVPQENGIMLEVEDLNAFYNDLQNRDPHSLQKASPSEHTPQIVEQPWGKLELHLRDPFKNKLTFTSKPEPIKKKTKNPIVIHYVYDMERAKKFYAQAFEVTPLFESSGWTTLDFGAIELALHILAGDDENTLPHAGLNFEVENIEEMQANIERLGGKLIQLREPSGGVPVRVATFKDSEGNGFELRQQP